MADYVVRDTQLVSVANAIRAKGGTSASLAFPAGFVSAIGDIPTGGGVTVSPLSVTTNGTYTAPSGEAYSPVTVNVPSGGGGASNVVTGTFTGTTKGSSLSVPIPYDGTGQPIVVLIYPSEGPYNSNGTFYNAIQRYAVQTFIAMRSVLPLASTDSTTIARYKSSSSGATSYNQTGSSTEYTFAAGTPAASSANKIVRCWSNTPNQKIHLAVFIANTSYGFMADVPYTYQIIMSE